MTDRSESRINDGGPAFPLPVADMQCRSRFESGYGGMTLRDYFAAKALPAVLARGDVHGHIREWENAAWISYQIADAMLRARESELREET